MARAFLSRRSSIRFRMLGRQVQAYWCVVVLLVSVISVALVCIFAQPKATVTHTSVEYPFWESLRSP